ncbi:TonB-dependent receptor [Chitinophaga flava]|uniref:TonB-dependent receptor n=1 Tax=Chitinophaga flava TaxID=2259036 RepID=A0A365XSJ6_9BACT|nr:TonB-dependent receptor [Chitinophaga flava]RBL89337.1 TonB-dependent receptor [Chitinophaga flava]
MKKLLAFIICMSAIGLCKAQHATVSGHVTDTLNHVQLPNTVVALLHAKDSILYRYTRTSESGNFKLDNLKAGKYLLMITYPAFADYVEPVTLSDTSVINYAKIMLTLRSRLLQEVVIQQKVAAIKIKGDTTEFNADSYKTQANATVEELLKKLPGIQVDNKGQITAQGESVKKVLVDGEEFFGDDPTLVTKNIRADMVDKVQLYDKKSDQAAFTGVDDGQSTKTLNLKLKDGKKNGYFGKVATGAGPQGFHDSQAMINMFKKKMKMAAFGIVSNTGKTGLTWQEQDKYGQSLADNAVADPSGEIYFSGAGEEFVGWDGKYDGKGYPLVQTGGLHYNNKWDQDKKNVNGNYKFMQLFMDGDNTTATKNLLPNNTSSYRNMKEHFNNYLLRHRMDGRYEVQLDSSSSIKFDFNGGLNNKKSNSTFLSEFLDGDSALVNRNSRRLTTTDDARELNSNLLWRKKLKKKGRTISVNLSENYSRNNGDGYLYSFTEYFDHAAVDSTHLTDQRKVFNGESLNLIGNVTYTEPLSKLSSLVVNYGVNITNSRSDRTSFNMSTPGKYELQDSAFSNNYSFNMLTHKGGLSYVFVGKKVRINVGNNIGLTSYRQEDRYLHTTNDRNFVNWFPSAGFKYIFSQRRRFTFNYTGNTQQPSMFQLQPLRSNEDDQDVRVGNPGLKPSFNNSFRISYSDYKVITDRNLWVSMFYSSTSNAFGESATIDAKGKRITQIVNIDGNENAGMNLNMGWKVNKINIGYYLRGYYYRNANYIDHQLNITRSLNSTLGLNVYASKEKKYDHYFAADVTYNASKSSVQRGISTNYWTSNIVYAANIFLPLKFELRSEMNYNIRQQTAVFTGNNNAFIWNASVNKKIGKKDALEVNVSVNDMLNQNIGFSRSVNSNFISQNTYSTIGRYGLVTLIWNFNKAGGGAVAKN